MCSPLLHGRTKEAQAAIWSHFCVRLHLDNCSGTLPYLSRSKYDLKVNLCEEVTADHGSHLRIFRHSLPANLLPIRLRRELCHLDPLKRPYHGVCHSEARLYTYKLSDSKTDPSPRASTLSPAREAYHFPNFLHTLFVLYPGADTLNHVVCS